jgi:hypothetical protein
MRTNLRPIARAIALAERGLADAGRADEGEDRAADLVGEGAHREVLEDALLDLLEAVVVLVEDLGGLLDVVEVLGRDVPRQADEPVDVGRMTPTSGEADGIRLIRSTSLSARALTSSGMPAFSTFSRSSLVSACCGSSSPSSRWMAFICSRRMYSRWVLSISDLTSDWIRPLSSWTSIWWARNAEAIFSRSATSIVSSSSWRCSVVMSGEYAVMSARRPGSVMLRAATAASGGTGAPAWTYCSTWAWTERISAWTSTSVDGCLGQLLDAGPDERLGRREAVQAHARLALDDRAHGAVLELDDLGDLGNRPDRIQLAGLGDVLLVSLALGHEGDPATLRNAALSAATLFSRPTCSGTIISGKITVSRSATSGSSVMVMVCSSSVFDVRFGIGFSWFLR